MNRKWFDKAVLLMTAVIVTAIYIFWGNTAVTVTEITLSDSRIPEGFDGYSIVQISDLHSTLFGKDNADLEVAVKSCDPDIIVITGDLVDYRNGDVSIGTDIAGKLANIAPTYFVSGNHENDRKDFEYIAARLWDAGVYVMRNERVTLTKGDDSISLIGIDDPVMLPKHYGQNHGERIDALLGRLMPGAEEYTVLLAHRPEFIDVYSKNGVCLTFSGHAHGGQFILPFIGGLYAPGQGILPQYTEGVHRMNEAVMITSRGLGNSGFPFRINNRPEIVVVHLDSAK